MELIKKYFPNISLQQETQLNLLEQYFLEWNEKINLISRKDQSNFAERHILHSLAIAKVIEFKKNTRILDIGTGGGFPGLPLAILFPEVKFYLIDSIGKKIMVVKDLISRLKLENVTAEKTRAEDHSEKYDFIVSRAVTALPKFVGWTKGKFLNRKINKLENGILYLKGGDIQQELKQSKRKYKVYPIKNSFEGEFFETKLVVHLY